MKNSDKCGVYQILCIPSGRLYVGSSVRIYTRWYEHRRSMRLGISRCHALQRAWYKYGENAFRFTVLEQCDAIDLQTREQFYINALKPALNILHADRRSANSLSVKAKSRTHCLHGHLYDEANTYFGRHGEKICRACNAERVAAIYAAQTPEQRAARIAAGRANYQANQEDRAAKSREYMATRKDEKRAYDRGRRARKAELRRKAIENETPEERAERLRKKRAAHHRALGREDGLPPPRQPMSEAQRAKIRASLTGRNLRPRNEPWVAEGISKTTYFRRLKLRDPAEREKLREYKRECYHRNIEIEREKMRLRYHKRIDRALAP